ncbi:MAG: proline dehydrogenase family protein [Chloroflexota bacterium]|nr:proline dehydrogenase family protein [Chloroflexota bacterium]
MLSALIFALSRSGTAERIATSVPGFRGFSRRFVAGQRQADALAAVARLNAGGFDATVSYLGEAVTSEREVRAAVAESTSFAAAAQARGLRSSISIKLTELGLAFDRPLAERSLDEVLRAAAAAGTFVRIDMEDARYTEATLDIFRRARERHTGVGVVIQAYLRRSAADIDALAREGAPVRLVKGAYREAETMAFASKREVDESFTRLADAYFAAMAPGGRLAVATHDGRMVRAALRSARRHGVAPDRYEFQMLYGIRPELQRSLRARGYGVRIYVPYGTHWYPYLMRRLAERPANLWFFLRNGLRR